MTTGTTHYLTPAETVERSGFSLDTLRYYERVGLLPALARSPSGHRRFTQQDLRWLSILRCLRDTGMPIADMRRYADLVHRGDPESLAERVSLLEKHDAAVEEHIAVLHAQRQHLREKIRYYRSLQSE